MRSQPLPGEASRRRAEEQFKTTKKVNSETKANTPSRQAEAAALTGRHSAGDEIGSTRGFRVDRSAEGTESETDGSTGCRFGLKSASASWRALERRRALALRARSLTSNSASRSVAERARWSFVLKVLQQKTMLVSLLRCDESMLATPRDM